MLRRLLVKAHRRRRKAALRLRARHRGRYLRRLRRHSQRHPIGAAWTIPTGCRVRSSPSRRPKPSLRCDNSRFAPAPCRFARHHLGMQAYLRPSTSMRRPAEASISSPRPIGTARRSTTFKLFRRRRRLRLTASAARIKDRRMTWRSHPSPQSPVIARLPSRAPFRCRIRQAHFMQRRSFHSRRRVRRR
jgi:hypothetical protein